MSELQHDPRDIPIKDQLERLFAGVAEQAAGNLGALFTAIVEREDIASSQQSEHLADFDDGTQRAQLKFDQDIVALQHQDILATAGLGFGPDVFSGDLRITDAERFVQTLAAVPETSTVLQNGLRSILQNFLYGVAHSYIPESIEFDRNTYEEFRFDPQWASAPESDIAASPGILLRANDIVQECARLEVSRRTARELEALHTAEVENLTREWAVAYHWGLLAPPTTSWADSHWVQWSEQAQWTAFFGYLQHMRTTAPPDSKFTALVIGTMLENVEKLRGGVLEPTEYQPITPPSDEPDDELEFFQPLDEEDEKAAAEQDRQYDQLLDSVIQQLRNIAHR